MVFYLSPRNNMYRGKDLYPTCYFLSFPLCLTVIILKVLKEICQELTIKGDLTPSGILLPKRIDVRPPTGNASR